MTTFWILIILGSSNRPPVVVERFDTQRDCEVAAAQIKAVSSDWAWNGATCLKVTREKP